MADFSGAKITLGSVDSSAYGIYVTESMPVCGYEAKSVFEEDWPDEDGVDTYDAAKVYVKATDMVIPMIAVGSNCVSNYRSFLTAITTGGTLKTLYSPWTGETNNKVRFVKADPEAPVLGNGSKSYMKFKLTLKLTQP